MPKKELITGTGRRKTAVARVFITKKPGKITVNDQPVEEYFADASFDKLLWKRPFNLVGIKDPQKELDISVKVHGSGKSAQLDAVVHGLAWALANMNEDYAEVLRQHDMLTRDSRMVERKKYWLRKARKAPQYSKR